MPSLATFRTLDSHCFNVEGFGFSLARFAPFFFTCVGCLAFVFAALLAMGVLAFLYLPNV
jgi:hypothetical protein